MPLTRQQLPVAAAAALREYGLGGLSIRRLANDLGVQPDAFYYHVPSKQNLVAAVGEHILAATGPVSDDPAEAAQELRSLLMAVRDGADVIAFVYAYRRAALAPFAHLGDTLIHCVPGFVAVEQNRAELIRAHILKPAGSEDQAFRARGANHHQRNG